MPYKLELIVPEGQLEETIGKCLSVGLFPKVVSRTLVVKKKADKAAQEPDLTSSMQLVAKASKSQQPPSVLEALLDFFENLEYENAVFFPDIAFAVRQNEHLANASSSKISAHLSQLVKDGLLIKSPEGGYTKAQQFNFRLLVRRGIETCAD